MTPRDGAFALLAAASQMLVAGAVAAQNVVVVRGSDCQQLIRAEPAPDVAYQGGVDAYGRPVAPADLNGGYPDIKPPEEIVFPVEIDLRNFQRGPEADAQASSAAVIAANKATDAATAADAGAAAAESAAVLNPGNTALAQAAALARQQADQATAAVTAGGKSQAASAAAQAVAAASAALPADAGLAAAAQTAQSSATAAGSANDALQQQFRSAERVGQFLGKPIIGVISVKGDQVYFNGKPIQPSDEAALAAACREALHPKK